MDLGRLWRFREVALFLAWRDVKLRYRQTMLGVLWVLLQPIATTALFTGIFRHLVRVPSDGVPYPVFAFAGLTAWTYVSTSVQSGANSLVESRELVTKLYFPRLLAPLAAVLASLIDLAVALVALAVLVAVYDSPPGAAVALLPVWIVGLVLVAAGAATLLSALNARYRDVKYALPFLLQLWLFASPVVFPASLIHGGARYVYALNPLAGLIDCLRWSALGAPAPPAADWLSAVACAVLLLFALIYFRRTESVLADLI